MARRFTESTDDAYVGGEVTVIAPKISGVIVRVAVADNQRVRAGDLLLVIDRRDYEAALARAEAGVAAAESALTNIAANRALQLVLIEQADASVAVVVAEVERAHDDRTRYEQLVAAAAESVQLFQQADTTLKGAQANERRARAAAEAARHGLDVLAAQAGQARAALAAAIAARDLARLDLEHTELRAPIDGFVGNRSARLGAFATVGAQLLVLVPADGLWVDANFKETQLAELRVGQPVTIRADAAAGRVFHGRVASLSPATGAQFSVLPPENATGSFTKIVQRVPVRIALEPEGAALGALRPGLSATVVVDERPALEARP